MPQKPFTSETVIDALSHFEKGMHSGIDADLLPKTQLAFATNATVRGTYIQPRPPLRLLSVSPSLPTGLRWQGASYYKPDQGLTPVPESMVASIGGRLFQITPDATALTATMTEVTIPADPNGANDPQAWMFQAEKWMIINNGVRNPIFFDGTTSVRSNYAVPLPFNTTTATTFWTRRIGEQVTNNAIPPVAIVVAFTDVTNLLVGDIVTFVGVGQFYVSEINVANVTLINQTGSPSGKRVLTGSTCYWSHIGTQLPPGRMGAYGMGRVWECLTDGKQFVAGDLVGGSSGTAANNYRDAVLYVTENTQLASGGTFTVPGSVGDIRAMIFTATLDVSLGQGPLQIFTPDRVFSCQTPTDRTAWQGLTNPIVTQSLISSGALGQESTKNANSDTIFRSTRGVESLILARREANTWGNTPISLEMDRVYVEDTPGLLPYGTATVFDNRHLMSAAPASDPNLGVYHRGLVALNFDPVASLGGKSPSVYDGLWTGLNILQVVTGMFNGVERTFVFALNLTTSGIELWELQKTGDAYFDNGNVPIVWSFESPTLNFGVADPRQRQLMRLIDGEIYVDSLIGRVDFQAFYRPDRYPCWVPWFEWSECSNNEITGDMPQFRPRMGMGEPSGKVCDASTSRPLREGYDFQFRLVVSGQCRFLGARFKAITLPEPMFAKPQCVEVCQS